MRKLCANKSFGVLVSALSVHFTERAGVRLSYLLYRVCTDHSLRSWSMFHVPTCTHNEIENECACCSRLQEYCERLMFFEPVEYGRRAEELLWRKVYYDIIQLMKHNRKVCLPRTLRQFPVTFRTISKNSVLPTQQSGRTVFIRLAANETEQNTGECIQNSFGWSSRILPPLALQTAARLHASTGRDR